MYLKSYFWMKWLNGFVLVDWIVIFVKDVVIWIFDWINWGIFCDKLIVIILYIILILIIMYFFFFR